MRTIPPALSAALGAAATTLALCVRIVRMDGVALGFTTHDRPLVLGGLIHEPAPGLDPSAIDLGGAEDAEAGELTGGLPEDARLRDDLREGRFDAARVTVELIDWEQPAAGSLPLLSGRLGRIEVNGEAFSASIRTGAAALEADPIECCSPECRASLGDPRCRVNLAGRRRIVAAASVPASATIEWSGPDAPAEAYAHGRLRVLTGMAAGEERVILASGAGSVALERPVARLAEGDLIELTEGCDKRLATCRDRFGNAVNFQGEPHVPGGDSAIRYGAL